MSKVPQKIAVVTHTHPSITRGGAEISALALHRGFLQSGVDSVLISACPRKDCERVILGPCEYVIDYEPQDYDHYYHIASPDVADAFVDTIIRLGVTVVMAHHFLFIGLNTVQQLVARGVRVTLTLHEFLAVCYNHGQMLTTAGNLCDNPHPGRCSACFPDTPAATFAVRRQFVLESLEGVHAYIAPSRFLAHRMVEWGLPGDRMHVIENGLVDHGEGVARPRPAEPTAGTPLQRLLGRVGPVARRALVVGYFGQLNPFKGLETILRTAELLAARAPGSPDISLRIHGNVVHLERTVQARFDAAIASGIVDYRGSYDNNQVGALMSACDYILMASRWYENSPVVIQEAFAAKRPMIVPNIGGMAEKVKDGVNGLHFRRLDSADLVDVLTRAARLDRSAFTFPEVETSMSMARNYLEIAADRT